MEFAATLQTEEASLLAWVNQYLKVGEDHPAQSNQSRGIGFGSRVLPASRFDLRRHAAYAKGELDFGQEQ
jgi:hypothetical protein